MITKVTHRIDWNRTAKVIGVVLFALGKAIWWLAKKGGLLLVAVLTVLAKVFVSLVSVWASVPEEKNIQKSDEADDGDLGIDVESGDLSRHGPGRRRVEI